MGALIITLVISLIILWLIVMYGVWKSSTEEHSSESLTELPLYQKSTRRVRRLWFWMERIGTSIRAHTQQIALRVFLFLFPKARKAFEQTDSLTGLKDGPSSYFLKSISEEKAGEKSKPKIIRRKRKNV